MGWWERRQREKKEKDRQPYELFKFQRPLFLIGANPTVLIYNESRVHTFSVPYDPAEFMELFRGQPKVYAWARFNHDKDHFDFDQSREIIRNPAEFPKW